MTYRLVNRVYAMVVAPPSSNVFLALQLLDAAAKVLVGVSKGVDVTPDKVAKRYTEVSALLRPPCSSLLHGALAACLSRAADANSGA